MIRHPPSSPLFPYTTLFRSNIGARHAHGELILFLDADVRIHDDALGRAVEHFGQDPSLDAVIGAYDDKPAAEPFVSRHRNLLDRKSTRLNSSHSQISYAVFC